MQARRKVRAPRARRGTRLPTDMVSSATAAVGMSAQAAVLYEPRPLETVRLFGQDLAMVDLGMTVDHLVALTDLDRASYVVTTNVDHVVELSKNERFRRAYAGAAVRLADGAPVVAVGRLTGRALPSRVTGADLLPAMCREAALLGLRVAIVGGSSEINAIAIERLRVDHPGLDVSRLEPVRLRGRPVGVPRDRLPAARAPAAHRVRVLRRPEVGDLARRARPPAAPLRRDLRGRCGRLRGRRPEAGPAVGPVGRARVGLPARARSRGGCGSATW